MIRVLIVDDQKVVTEGLRVILNSEDTLEVIGVAHNGAQAVELVSTMKPDLVLMDLKMPIMNGIHATKAIKENHPEVKVLVLTTYDADAWLFDAVRNGADGYLLKDTSREDLIQAISEVTAGKTPVDSKVAGKLFSQINRTGIPGDSTIGSKLSEREKEVLKLISHGRTNAEIAESLYLSEGTIRNYVSSILEKLDVKDRTQAAVLALRHGLVE